MSLTLAFAAALLLLGVLMRQWLPLFRVLYIPASVIAGFIGLGILAPLSSDWGSTAHPGLSQWAEQAIETLATWPGELIAIVFAAMMLQPPDSGSGDREEIKASNVARQGLMAWIIVLGQTAVGALATWLLIKPWVDVPNSFGMLIETGFAGGHATASAMGEVFNNSIINFPIGKDLGLLMATLGLVYGIISGIVFINIGVRLGWAPGNDGAHESSGDSTSNEKQAAKPKSTGFAVWASDTIDPMLLQLVWIALAVGLGALMQLGVQTAATRIDQARATTAQTETTANGKTITPIESSLDDGAAIESTDAESTGDNAVAAKPDKSELSKRLKIANVLDFPLFIYAMLGGFCLRKLFRGMGWEHRIDPVSINHIGSAAMEVLVVAAIASLKLSAVVAWVGPLLVLFLCGSVWCCFCLLVLSRWILPKSHWFQLGLINYGMSTGTTATGLVLLRVVDPDLRTSAAGEYALAAPISAPFIGGGILTFALPLLFLESFPLALTALVLAGVITVLILIGIRANKRQQPNGS
ncbi:Sodium/glutamate symporter [Stieleria bergensis]|uniref:Sodium/glutamate symporter n=1 Tax=Stieleria bergensis TaxID=2528025 RepID=A0A517SQA7_9BACT|nr:Sodium/glutamate symporter [Planctomycetes bacterium SV_7m_r]